ncbi:MAG: hypothetical protein Kow0037_04300 [Calditrichia bacterium]
MKIINFLLILTLSMAIVSAAQDNSPKKMGKSDMSKQNKYELATFAGGCFWCMQPPYDDLPGVIKTTVGYTGGDLEDPTYEEVSTGKTGHLEAVQIQFDPSITSYRELLGIFWRNIDPTNPAGQFADYGSQYKTAIFYHNEEQKKLARQSLLELEKSGKFDKPIVTDIRPATTFYPAEAYHQEFYKKNPLRYNSYKVGSGREVFLKKTWKEEK